MVIIVSRTSSPVGLCCKMGGDYGESEQRVVGLEFYFNSWFSTENLLLLKSIHVRRVLP